MYTCLFSRLTSCAPVVANACGSSGSPMLWTRSKSGEKALKNLLKAFELLRPHQLAAYSHGAALTTRAQLSARAQTFARGTWGYWVGCCYQKQQNLYIYVFFFFIFHFLYDFSKSIGTTHPFNLNRKKRGRETTHAFLLLQNHIRVPANPATLEGTQSYRGLSLSLQSDTRLTAVASCSIMLPNDARRMSQLVSVPEEKSYDNQYRADRSLICRSDRPLQRACRPRIADSEQPPEGPGRGNAAGCGSASRTNPVRRVL